MSAVVLSYAQSTHPALDKLAESAVAASNDPNNVFLGPNNDKPNTVYVVANDPESIRKAIDANWAARVAELRAAGRDADADELDSTTDATKPLQPFQPAEIPASPTDNPVTAITECRHFRLGTARLLWAFISDQPAVALLPASAPLPRREAAAQLLEYANSKQPTTHASLDAGAAFSICAKWVFADDRAALLGALRAGSGTPAEAAEKATLARLAYQILLLDNQAARKHGFSYEPVERALGATTHAFPALEQLVAVANGSGN